MDRGTDGRNLDPLVSPLPRLAQQKWWGSDLSLHRRNTIKHGAEEKPGGGGGGGQGRWSYERYRVGIFARRRGGGGEDYLHPNLWQVLILIHKSMPKSRPSRSVFPSSVLLCFAVPRGWKLLFPDTMGHRMRWRRWCSSGFVTSIWIH